MEPVTTEAALPAKRPKFLTVLCILSFVGIGISLVSGIISYFSYSTLANAGGMLNSIGAGVKDGEKIGESMNALANAMGMDYGKWALVVLIQTILNIPILVGVLMMWKQKKVGFYIYAPFEIIQPVMPIIFGLGLFGGLSAILSLIFAIVFVVLYALNLKHMNGGTASDAASASSLGQKQNPAAGSKSGTFYEIRVGNVTCVPVGATFKVGMTVTAKKFATDSKTGKVKEEMINDEIQIGMVKDGKEIYLKSYKFTKTSTLLNLTLNQKPDKIGVDPYNKLPEKV
ncbi:MAG: hypothetical protein K8R85_06135 [Bacteroidetes bacterium]|nr:hypothetical protein [Bacteroidota bacterium]